MHESGFPGHGENEEQWWFGEEIYVWTIFKFHLHLNSLSFPGEQFSVFGTAGTEVTDKLFICYEDLVSIRLFVSEIIPWCFFNCSVGDLLGAMWGWHSAAGWCQPALDTAKQGKASRVALHPFYMVDSQSCRDSGLAIPPSSPVPIPWLDYGKASSWPLFWATEETMSSTANICRQKPLCRAHTWPSHPCTGHPSSHSAQGNSAHFLNAQVSLIILMTALLNKTKPKWKSANLWLCNSQVFPMSSVYEATGAQGIQTRVQHPPLLVVPWHLCHRHCLAVAELDGILGPAKRWGLLLTGLICSLILGSKFPIGWGGSGLVGLYCLQRILLGHGWRGA